MRSLSCLHDSPPLVDSTTPEEMLDVASQVRALASKTLKLCAGKADLGAIERAAQVLRDAADATELAARRRAK